MSKLKRVLSASLRSFLPGAAIVLGSISFGMAVSDPLSFGLIQAGVIALEITGLTIGFGAVVLAMLPRLRSDAGIQGRKSFVAGLCAPLALGFVSIFAQGTGLIGIGVISMGAGGLLAMTMFAPWLTRGPSATPIKELTAEPEWLTQDLRQPDEQPVRHRTGKPTTENAA